jgi:hypothetical protein
MLMNTGVVDVMPLAFVSPVAMVVLMVLGFPRALLWLLVVRLITGVFVIGG